MDNSKKSNKNYHNLTSPIGGIKEFAINDVLKSLSETDFKVLVKSGKRSSIICGFDFDNLINFTFRFVKDSIPEYLSKGNIEDLIKLGLSEKGKEFVKPEPKEVIAFVLWIHDELESIADMEKNALSKDPKPEMVLAGVDRFNKYGDLNVVYSLCEKFGWTEEYVWNKKYSDVFNLQLYGKDTNEFNEDLNKIISKKKK